jgi:acyl-CoA synthetase (AMP-forming)/AMP-acid ligase II
VAYEKSLARTRALAARRPRPLGDLRMRPAPVISADRGAWMTRTIAAVLEQHFTTLRDRAAITLVHDAGADGRQFVDWSWGDLDRESARMAAYLHDCGVAAGQVVYLLTGHGAFTVSAIVGALRLGAVPSIGHAPSPKLSAEVFAETFAELVRRSAPALVIVPPDLEPLIRQCLAAADLERAPSVVSSSAVAFRLDDRRARTWPEPPDRSDRLALLQHSSGTTGARKAVIFTDSALLRQIYDYAQAIDLRHDDRIVSWLPLYHDMGLVACFLLPLLTGTPLTLMSPFEWVAAPEMLFEAIGRDRGTLAWLPNFAFHLLADRVDPSQLTGLDLSSVRAFVNCSEPVGRESWRRFHERFAFHGLSRFAFATCYAMAENVFAVTQGGTREPVLVDVVDAERLRSDGEAAPVDLRIDGSRPLRAVPASGRPVGDCRIRIVNARQGRRTLPDRRVGEIEIASESLAPGYYNNQAATRAGFHGEWYRTSDIGYLADGHLFVLGRQSDVIIVAGIDVLADDVEAMASGVAGVKPGRVAAFGVSDRRLGTERVVVLFECAGAALDDDAEIALRRSVQQRLHDALGLATCEVLTVPAGAIRKTSSGKVGRRRMKELFESGSFAPRDREMARSRV